MKRALSALLFVCLLTAPVSAGHIPIPPEPPCTQNCTKQATISPIPLEIILLLIEIATKR